MTDDFIKFPHTPHLVWLDTKKPRNDKLLPADDAEDFLKGHIIVEEKVDGANLGFSLSSKGDIRVQNRGGYLGHSSHPQFSPLWAWLSQRQYAFKNGLDGIILFGEWCFARHSIVYDKLPDWLLVFDVFDKAAGTFWSSKKRNELARLLGLAVVPKLAEGQFTVNDVLDLLSDSKITNGPMEGIYLRRENESTLNGRAKIVRAEFIQEINAHWSKGELKKNTLIAEGTV